MKPYDEIEIKESSPEYDVVKGQTGIIVDLLQGETMLIASIELDAGTYDDSDDDGIREVPVHFLKVTSSSQSAAV